MFVIRTFYLEKIFVVKSYLDNGLLQIIDLIHNCKCKNQFIFRKAIKSALSWTLFIPVHTMRLPGMYLWGLLKKWKRCSSFHLKFAFLKYLLDLKPVLPVFLPINPPNVGAYKSESSILLNNIKIYSDVMAISTLILEHFFTSCWISIWNLREFRLLLFKWTKNRIEKCHLIIPTIRKKILNKIKQI